MSESPTRVTSLLLEWREGRRDALDQLMPIVYDELRRLAARHLRSEHPDHSLQATALVHEVFGRLVDASIDWQDRAHFFAVTATTMRRILVEHARAKGRLKRGGGWSRTTLDGVALVSPEPDTDYLALDDALARLSVQDERKARAVELHYFGGLSYEEGAAVLGVSPATYHRDLRFAKAWLLDELTDEPGAA